MTTKLPGVQRLETIDLGDGILFLGTLNTAFDSDDLNEVGGIAATAQVTFLNEFKSLELGSPQRTTKVMKYKDGVQVKVSIYEVVIERLRERLGFGTLATTLQGTDVITGEQKILYGTSWAQLQNDTILVSPVPTVTDGGATPVTYSSTTDYELDRTNGIIRRRSGGIILDGQRVYCNYSCTRGQKKTLTVPMSTTINYIPVRFVSKREDGKWILDLYKAVPPSGNVVWDINFAEFNTLDMEFIAEPDLTRAITDQLYSYMFIKNPV